MNGYKFFMAMEQLDERFIDEASPSNAQPIKKARQMARIRLIAFAACLCLVFSVAYPVILEMSSPKFDIPIYTDAIYSVGDISNFFSHKYSGGVGGVTTSRYKKVFVPTSRYLYLSSVPEKETISIYSAEDIYNEIDEEEFEDFVDGVSARFGEMIGEPIEPYKIKSSVWIDEEPYLQADIQCTGNKGCSMEARQSFDRTSANITSSSEIYLDGEKIEIDQTQTDRKIIKSLEGIKEKLFYIFGREFTDVKIDRYYGWGSTAETMEEAGVWHLRVIYYNKEDHPLNQYSSQVYSDNITISFQNFTGSDNPWLESEKYLSHIGIYYRERRVDLTEKYPVAEEVRMITLEEAERLYRNGLFFSNENPYCYLVKGQDEVCFSSYDFVGMEYLSGNDKTGDGTVFLPFYKFVKKIGRAKNRNIIYAVVYVPAIEVSGYEEYLAKMKDL